jgi:hypothetical protein
MKFKQGDWCFCEFELKQIVKIEDNCIKEITDGYSNHMSSDLSNRCFPLNISIKRISHTVHYWSEEFFKFRGKSLNYPDLHRELVRRWVEMCENSDKPIFSTLYNNLEQFAKSVISKVNSVDYEEVEGIKIFSR